MMELYLSFLPNLMPSSVCACNLEQLSAFSVSCLNYPIYNHSNHVLGSVLELWMSSNVMVSFRPNRTGNFLHHCCMTYR